MCYVNVTGRVLFQGVTMSVMWKINLNLTLFDQSGYLH